MDEIRAESWVHLQELLYEDSWQPELSRHRSSSAFRGRGDAREGLVTSLQRLGGEAAELEGKLLRNFRKYAQRSDVPFESVWNWLALGQHHGLPTRLLDWTFSPYAALHFVTARPPVEADGVVWCVDYRRAHAEAPAEVRGALDEDGADVFTAELLDRVAPGLAELDRLGDFALFFEPPSLDDRIVNQYALFSLMSSPVARLDEWLAGRPGLARRVVVPAELKWEVRDKLDQANVTERVLFPGLDGLSRWLKRYYSPRG